jgi:hypothetical protein
MDLNPNNFLKKAEDHAFALAFGLGTISHAKEAYGSYGAALSYFMNDLKGAHGPFYELMYDVENPEFLVWKIWDSGHLYSKLFKLGTYAYLADMFGLKLIAGQGSLGKKLMKGAGLAAALNQGSGDGTGPASNSGRTRSDGGYWSVGQ